MKRVRQSVVDIMTMVSVFVILKLTLRALPASPRIVIFLCAGLVLAFAFRVVSWNHRSTKNVERLRDK